MHLEKSDAVSRFNRTPIRDYTDHFSSCQAFFPGFCHSVRVSNETPSYVEYSSLALVGWIFGSVFGVNWQIGLS